MGEEDYQRPGWDETFLDAARVYSRRATCHRRRFGAVIVKGNKEKASGYNGAASKLKDCLERGHCMRQRLSIAHGTQYETCRSVHAEVNAMLNAGPENCDGAALYLCGEKGGKGHELLDSVPCSMCARIILNAHIEKVVARMADGSIKIYTRQELNDIADHFNVPKTPLKAKMIIGVTALARAGKDTFALYLKEKYGFQTLNMSDVLADELARRGMEPTKDNRSLLGDEWRKQHGMDIVIRKTLEKAQAYDNVVITGVRSVEEVDFLRNNSKGFCLVAVVADQDIRFSRIGSLDPETPEAFTARDERDVKNKGLGKVIGAAEHTLTNNYTIHEPFYRDIDALMQKIKEA